MDRFDAEVVAAPRIETKAIRKTLYTSLFVILFLVIIKF
jgi:hypothetical protein